MYQLMIVSLIALAAAVSSAEVFPRDVDVRVNKVFVPVGFDDNDEVVVVVDGYLPDPCYRLNYPQVTVDEKEGKVIVRPRARQFRENCPALAVPYSQEIYVGRLPNRTFQLSTYDGAITEPLAVKKGTDPGPDDYLYAPIDRARAEQRGNQWMAVLEGRFSNSCLVIEEIKVSLTGNTIQVLPVMKLLTESESGHPCEAKESNFQSETELPTLTQAGRYLLHVRSLHGRAVNDVFTNPGD